MSEPEEKVYRIWFHKRVCDRMIHRHELGFKYLVYPAYVASVAVVCKTVACWNTHTHGMKFDS